MMDIEIKQFQEIDIKGERSDIVAIFNARVGDFNIRKGQLRRRLLDGHMFLSVSDSRKITLPNGCPTREALMEMVVQKYKGAA